MSPRPARNRRRAADVWMRRARPSSLCASSHIAASLIVALTLLSQTHSTLQQAVGCPYPSVGSNCQVNIVAQAPAVPLLSTEFVADEFAVLKPDTQASYKCDHGYELLGSDTITCLASGRWSAHAPACVTNVALAKPTNQSSTVKGGESRNANDGKLITQHDSKYCTETRVDQSPWWQIDLLQLYEIKSVRVLGRACCNPSLLLHDVEIRVGNSSTLQGNRLCAWYPNNLDEGVARDFQCAHPIVGRFVSIQMVGIEAALSLCEVMVFSTKEFPADRCSVQSTLAPSANAKPASSASSANAAASTTTSATTTSASSLVAADSQMIVFNRTCYEMQTTNGGSFLVADTYCRARGGSLLHSVSNLTQTFIANELERMKAKLKSKLVWLGAKRETASPNALGSITAGSSSAAFAPSDAGWSERSALRDMASSESIFMTSLSTGSELAPFVPARRRVTRAALPFQASSGAGGSMSRGSQTFGLPHASTAGVANRTVEHHTGRSLVVSQPSQIAAFFTPPVPLGNSGASSNASPVVAVSPPSSLPAREPSPHPTSFTQPHVHRSLRPPALVNTAAQSQQSSTAASPTSQSSPIVLQSSSSSSSSSSQSSSNSWRWTGDAQSETLQAPITSFLWADDQPNNYNNQQDCIVLDGGKRWLWNDVTCELDYLPWICQYRASTCGSPDRNENSTVLELPSTSAASTTTTTAASTSDAQQAVGEPAFQFGKTITYACPVGHKLEGSRKRRCQYDGTWSGRAPKCVYVNCGSLSSNTIENGRLVYLNQSQTTFDSQVKYVCYEDHVLVGSDLRVCQADGKWSGKQPYCAYKWCPMLQQISNGYLNVSSYAENSIATYSCQSGYKLIGNDTRQCLLGGKWTNQEPFCQYVDCGQPKPIANGMYQLVNATTNYLSVAQYTCNENYTLVGSSNKMVCSHNNRWTGKEPQCSLIDCGQPTALSGSTFSGQLYSVHSVVEYKCVPGYKEIKGSTQRTCGLDGQWTGSPLSCKYVDCGRVPAILKGEVSYINGTTYLASQVTYECTPGNRLSGHRVRFCGPDARWTGTSPKCEEVRCDAPELPKNGSAVYIGNDRHIKEQSFSVGVTVQYECSYGHVVKGTWSSRLCQANGEWSGEPPVCKFVDCGPAPQIDNGNYVLKHPPGASSLLQGSASSSEPASRRSSSDSNNAPVGTYYGTIAQYSCDNNYKLQGPAQRECLDTGAWRVPLPSCEPVQCPKPEFFDEYTQVSYVTRAQLDSAGDSPQSLAQVVAARAYTKLIANSQWLTDTVQAYSVGDKLLYSCVPGYEMYGGPEVRTCTQYGQWSGSSTPRCRLIDCGRPAPIGQEGRFYLLNETTTFNSIVEYSCVRPFKLVEVKQRQTGNLIETLTAAQAGVTAILTALPLGVKVCANNGQWMPNDQAPKCVSPTMSAPDIGGQSGGSTPNGGQFDGGDNSLGEGSTRMHILTSHRDSFAANAADTSDLLHQRSNNLLQTGAQSASASLWPKVIIAFCLMVMLSFIILTVICIRSGKRTPKQPPPMSAAAAAVAAAHAAVAHASGGGANGGAGGAPLPHHRASMHMPNGNAKTANNLQQQQAMAANYVAKQQAAAALMSGQNIYVNGNAHKVLHQQQLHSQQQQVLQMQRQLSSAQAAHLAAYGDAHAQSMMMAAAGRSLAGVGATSASPSALGDEMVLLANGGKSAAGVGVLAVNGGRRGIEQNAAVGHNGLMAESYARLSVESSQMGGHPQQQQHPNGAAMLASAANNKTIRHNPNGLVTFVSPAQQQGRAASQQHSGGHQHNSNHPQQQQQQQQAAAQSSQQHNHQVSPQSISLSISSSSSPSSSSSAHHTTATRLSTTCDSASSSSSSGNAPAPNANANANSGSNPYAQPQFQQAPLTVPPSLPAHPPPSHRLQQHQKQMHKVVSSADLSSAN